MWNAAFWQKLDEFVGRFTVSVLLKDARCGAEWVATSVYGPANVNDKVDFWAELNQVAGRWYSQSENKSSHSIETKNRSNRLITRHSCTLDLVNSAPLKGIS